MVPMRSRYTWRDLAELDAGSLPLVETPYGHPFVLESGDVAHLPSALRESLQAEGFDLQRGIVVSRDSTLVNGFVFKQ